MIQIRKGVFETNSSSTHSIAIPRKIDDYSGRSVEFNIGEFGWGFEEVDPADYLYTAICCMSNHEELLEILKDTLNRNEVSFTFGPVTYDSYGLSNGYIDHDYELCSFVTEVLADDNLTLNFIFDGKVFTGNDNSDADEYCFVNRNEEFYEEHDYDTNTHTKCKNPYYMEDADEYDWYYKGN